MNFQARLTFPSTNLTSTSGLLCLSTTWDEKLSKHMAAVKVCLTAVKYGRNVAAWN